MLLTDLSVIKEIAAEKEDENDAFRIFLKNADSKEIDLMVHATNDAVAPQIDCTQCGNYCRSLMINVTATELTNLSHLLETDETTIKEKYIEESAGGQLVINSIPCHFLSGSRCSIYVNRFFECREFPHLHKDRFTGRLFGTLQYYAMCPIIFNVVEALKKKTGFSPS